MNFKTETEIFQDMVRDGKEKGLLNLSDEEITRFTEGENTENQYILDFSTHAYIDAQLETKAEEIHQSVDLNTAQGRDLDNIGRWFGMTRAMPQYAQVYANIEMEVNEEETIIIPSGTGVIIDETILPSGDEYVTMEDFEITQGTLTGNVLCQNTRMGFTKALAEGCIQGFEGYPSIPVTNNEQGTTGRDLESDDNFRQRVQEWPTSQLRGSKTILDDYLSKRDGVDGYKLVPRWNGPGTLKIVIDCLPELVDTIQQEVHEVCMDYKDDLPLMELPGNKVIELLSFQVNLADLPLAMTKTELKQLISNHVYCWINGGSTRNNVVLHGMSIGEDFVPAQLLTSLVGTFPEILNIQCNIQEIVSVPDNMKLDVDEILVGFI